ncbi:MAG: DUF4416 family protein [Brevinematales bacterium]
MGKAIEHEPVKLVIGILFSDENCYFQARNRLVSLYGNVDYQCEPFVFTFTHYYDEEMGTPIFRTFLSFERLMQPEDLVDIKLTTNAIEEELAIGGRRFVNLDPGYMQMGKFVLATTKDQMHRIYLAKGIYAEVTLHYQKKSWQSWPWTYPDYASEVYKKILLDIRELYYAQLKAIGGNIPQRAMVSQKKPS